MPTIVRCFKGKLYIKHIKSAELDLIKNIHSVSGIAIYYKLLSTREIPGEPRLLLYSMLVLAKILFHPGNIYMQTITSKQSFVIPLIKGIDLTLGRVTLISCANAINSN